jgi:hypothetical protein
MVKITILNETGHTELTLSASEALDQIIDQEKKLQILISMQ